MKKLIIIPFVLFFNLCFSQGFFIYDANDYIKPSWLDPRNIGLDSAIKKIHYLSIFGGTGLNVNSQTHDSVFPNFYYNNFWCSVSYYTKHIQLNLKNAYQFGGIFQKKTYTYELYQRYSPKIQLGFYPHFGKSYIYEQFRLQFSWAPSIITRSGIDTSSDFTSHIEIDYGGFINKPHTNSPKIAILAQFYKNTDIKSVTTYGGTVFFGTPFIKSTNFNNNFYLQLGYLRKNIQGMDDASVLRVGIVDELYFNRQNNNVVYLFANYTFNFNQINLKKEKIIRKRIDETTIGLFFNFSFYNHAYHFR